MVTKTKTGQKAKPIKRTIEVKPTKTTTPTITIRNLPKLVEARLGWSPRVTKYYDANSADLKKIITGTGFTPQSPTYAPDGAPGGQCEIGDFVVQEIGALHDEKAQRDFRIVKVTQKG